MYLATAIGATAVAAWLYLLFGRGGFWRVRRGVTSNHTAQAGDAPVVVAIVPARNEAATIGRAVGSLLEQQYQGKLHIIVVDDESEDGTADAARDAANANPHHSLAVIRGEPRPEGWSGKVWAMQQGVNASREFAPGYFLFTDADVVHAPDTVASLLAVAEDGDYDLASLMVKLHCQSAPERLLVPAFVFFFFMIYPPRWIADRRRATAGAAGGCLLVRREALERAGGLAAIRGEVIDDCALARAIKPLPGFKARGARPGTNLWLGMTAETHSLRAYGSFAEIGKMIARTAFNQLRHSALLLVATISGMLIAFAAPVALVAGAATTGTQEQGLSLAGVLGLGAWLLMTVAYTPTARFYRLNPLWATTLPAAACFYMAATVWSAIKYWAGRGGEWKGRAQDQRAQGSRHTAQGGRDSSGGIRF